MMCNMISSAPPAVVILALVTLIHTQQACFVCGERNFNRSEVLKWVCGRSLGKSIDFLRVVGKCSIGSALVSVLFLQCVMYGFASSIKSLEGLHIHCLSQRRGILTRVFSRPPSEVSQWERVPPGGHPLYSSAPKWNQATKTKQTNELVCHDLKSNR